MNKPDLMYLKEFLDEVEAIMQADDMGITWELEDQLLNSKQIIKEALRERSEQERHTSNS